MRKGIPLGHLAHYHQQAYKNATQLVRSWGLPAEPSSDEHLTKDSDYGVVRLDVFAEFDEIESKLTTALGPATRSALALWLYTGSVGVIFIKKDPTDPIAGPCQVVFVDKEFGIEYPKLEKDGNDTIQETSGVGSSTVEPGGSAGGEPGVLHPGTGPDLAGEDQPAGEVERSPGSGG